MQPIELDECEEDSSALHPRSSCMLEELNLWEAAKSGLSMLGPLKVVLIPPVAVGAMAVLSAPGNLWQNHPTLSVEQAADAGALHVPGVLLEGARAGEPPRSQNLTARTPGVVVPEMSAVALPTLDAPQIQLSLDTEVQAPTTDSTQVRADAATGSAVPNAPVTTPPASNQQKSAAPSAPIAVSVK
jgi:hypothetical protein